MKNLPEGLTEQQLELCYQRNWFKLFMPAKFGGCEYTLKQGLTEIFKASSLDGNLGWCVNLGSGAGYFCGFMATEGAKSTFGKADAVAAGSGRIGTFTRLPNGYEISGEWERCTGSAHATSFTVNAEDQTGTNHSFILSPEQVEISDEWYIDGLSNSSTWCVRTEKAFVPPHLKFDIGTLVLENAYGIHILPYDDFARFCMLATLFGIAICFINLVKEEEYIFPLKAGEPVLQLEQYIHQEVLQLLDLADHFWNTIQKNRSIPEDMSKILTNHVQIKAKHIFASANEIYYLSGLRICDRRLAVHKAYQDLMVTVQHYLFK